MSIISSRMALIKPSPTLAVTQKASILQKAGRDIISLGLGEPDFDTPDNIKEAAILGLKQGHTKYTNVDGMVELKKAIQDKFKRENQLDYALNEIIVSIGGKQVIYNLFMATLNEGDEVIIPAPYWVSYPDIVNLSCGKSVFINCSIEDDFKMSPKMLEEAITDKTKWVIINSPSNPTGACYTKQELIDIADVIRKYPNIYVMSDDIYEHIIFDNFKFTTFAQIAPDLKDRIFTVNGVSKSYSMTGFRIGYGAGNAAIIKAMTVLQSQSTSNPCSISQVASIEALNGIQDYIKVNAANFQKKRDLVISLLSDVKGLNFYKPEGAFYLFIQCQDLFGKRHNDFGIISNSNQFSEYLLEYGNTAVVAGSAFGLEGYFRISYATSEDLLKEACSRIKAAINLLH